MIENRIEDSECIYMILQNDEESLKLLMGKYHPLIQRTLYRKANIFHWMRDESEVQQLSMITLYHAVLTYREDIYGTFQNYFLCVLKNGWIDESRRRSRWHTNTMSLDMTIKEDKGVYAVEAFPSTDPSLEADWRIRKEHMLQFLLKCETGMSAMERRVFRLRCLGYSYQEIAGQLNISIKRVDNILHKLRKNKGFIDYSNSL